MRPYTQPTHRKVLHKVYKVNNIPFRGIYPQAIRSTKNEEHQSRSPNSNGSRRRRQSPDDWWNKIYLGTLRNGNLEGEPVEQEEGDSKTEHVNTVRQTEEEEQSHENETCEPSTNGAAYVPFLQNARSEPVFQTKMNNGSLINVYVDTGAQVDLFPKNILNECFPEWRRRKTTSNTKLMAANETVIAHEGRIRIMLPLPGEAGLKG